MYNQSIEQQVLDLRAAGHSIRAIAAILEINKSKVEQILKAAVHAAPDSLFGTEEDTEKTVSENEKGKRQTLSERATDTFQTTPKPKLAPNFSPNKGQQSHLFSQINLFHEVIRDFIIDMNEVYSDVSIWQHSTYVRFPKRAARLSKIASLFCSQFGEDYEGLLVCQVLADIKATLLDTLQDKNQAFVMYDEVRPSPEVDKVAFWSIVLEADFFQLIND